MDTGGLNVQAQSRDEILADKLVAFALRHNRLKNRDPWDTAWLKQQGVVLPLELQPMTLCGHDCELQRFRGLLADRQKALLSESKMRTDFQQEMRRFPPATLVAETVSSPDSWRYLTGLIEQACQRAPDILNTENPDIRFRMKRESSPSAQGGPPASRLEGVVARAG